MAKGPVRDPYGTRTGPGTRPGSYLAINQKFENNNTFLVKPLYVMNTAGQLQPAASAAEFLNQVFGELVRLQELLAPRVAAGLGDSTCVSEVWEIAVGMLLKRTNMDSDLFALFSDAGFYCFQYLGETAPRNALLNKSRRLLPAVLEACQIPAELQSEIEKFLPSAPKMIDVLHRLCDGYDAADHHIFDEVRVFPGTCRGQAIISFNLSGWFPSGRYDWSSWTISPFRDGGFKFESRSDSEDSDEEPDREPDFELTSTYMNCDWPPGIKGTLTGDWRAKRRQSFLAAAARGRPRFPELPLQVALGS